MQLTACRPYAGTLLFWHFGGHLYIYKNAEAGTRPARHPLCVIAEDINENYIHINNKLFHSRHLRPDILGQKNARTKNPNHSGL